MQIESIGELMRYVNGDADDESDDIVSETELYTLFAEWAESGKKPETRLNAAAEKRLYKALRVMVCAYKAALFKEEAEKLFEKLKEE